MAIIAPVMKASTTDAIAAQYGIPSSQLATIEAGISLEGIHFLYDHLLNKVWHIPFGSKEQYLVSFSEGTLNGTAELEPVSVLHVNVHFNYSGLLDTGVILQSPEELVFHEGTNAWYKLRYTKNKTFPRIETAKHPDYDEWVNMGPNGLGMAYKGDKGDKGDTIDDISFNTVCIIPDILPEVKVVSNIEVIKPKVANELASPKYSSIILSKQRLLVNSDDKVYATIRVCNYNGKAIADSIPVLCTPEGNPLLGNVVYVPNTGDDTQILYEITGKDVGTDLVTFRVSGEVVGVEPQVLKYVTPTKLNFG